MKKGKIIILIVTLAAAFAIVFVITHLPKELEGTMTVCTADGETAEFSYDLQIFNNWIFPPYAKGKVSFNGVEYIDRQTGFKTHHVDSNYLFGLYPNGWWKNRSTIHNLFFYQAGHTDFMETTVNYIDFFSVNASDDIDRIFFGYTDKSNMVNQHISAVYFAGPAQNVEEAKQIAQSFGYNFD